MKLNLTHIVILLSILALTATVSISLGRWAESVNPEGIQALDESITDSPQNEQPSTSLQQSGQPRDAFNFGVSLGLLGCALFCGVIGAVLLLRAKSSGKPIDPLAYGVLIIAAMNLALSYLIDDYFI